MPHRMTPSWGFWLGVVLTLLGLAGGLFFIRAMAAIGGQPLAASDLAYSVAATFSAVVLPLGLMFVVFSLVARALEPTRVPPRVTSRIALATGVVLVVIGMISELYLQDWIQAIQADATFMRDFVVYLGPPLNALLLPLGVLLIPCAWILRIIEERQPQRISDSAIRQ